MASETDSSTPSDVGAEPKISVGPGSGASFDDLDAMMEASDEVKSDEIAEEASRKIQVSEKVVDTLEQQAQDAVDDVENASTPEEKRAAMDKVRKVRKLIAMQGDDEIELTSDARFKHKVAGEEVEVTLDDLLAEYAGKTAWNSRFGELGAKEKKFNDNMTLVNQNLTKLADLAKSGKPYEALEFLCQMAGVNEGEFVESYLKEAAGIAEEFGALDEDSQQTFLEKKKLAYEKREIEKQKNQQQSQQYQQQLEGYIGKVLNEKGIAPNEFKESYEYLLKENAIDSRLNHAEIVNYVAKFHTEFSNVSKAQSVIKELAPELLEDKEFVDTIINVANNGLSESDLKYVVKELLEDDDSDSDDDEVDDDGFDNTEAPAQESASRRTSPSKKAKSTKSKKQSSDKAKPKAPKAPEEEDIFSFDDLDDVY